MRIEIEPTTVVALGAVVVMTNLGLLALHFWRNRKWVDKELNYAPRTRATVAAAPAATAAPAAPVVAERDESPLQGESLAFGAGAPEEMDEAALDDLIYSNAGRGA